MQRDRTDLSDKEIHAFVHNAQLALCDTVADERIPAIFYYKKHLLSLFKDSTFTKTELACVLVSVAWELLKGEGNGTH